MRTTFALAAMAAIAYAAPQGVSENIPAPGTLGGCSASYSGAFQITAVNSTVARRDLEKRACGDAGSLTLTLAGGQLFDAFGRTGYIASNYQFQFDAPPQAGTIYSGGFSVCSNGSLALGSSAIFYQCLSGDFYNLYDRYWAAQCAPILIQVLPCASAAPASPPAPVSQFADGQPQGTAVAPAPVVTQIADGQIQASTAIPISQIADGQPQVPSAVISQIADGQIQGPTSLAGVPISQIPDGQIQGPTSVAPIPISQIPDGQIQASTAAPAPISQIPDGQIQASAAAPAPAPTPTAAPAPISQIPDGQIQAPTSAAEPAPTTAAPVVSSNATVITAPPTPSPLTASSGNTLAFGAQFLLLIGAAAIFLM